MNKAVSLLLSNLNNNSLSFQLEINRLSIQFGQPFNIKIKVIDIDKISKDENGEQNIYEVLRLGIEGFDSKELYDSLGTNDFNELIDKIFTLGEIKYIYEEIIRISTLNKDDIEVFKSDIGYEDAYWLWKHKYISAPSEYFKLPLVDKQVLSVFIERKESEIKDELTETINQIKSSKDPFSVQGQILFKLLYAIL